MTEKVECIRLVEKDMNGGKITKETIDKISLFESDSLQISGLRQDTFEYLIQQFGHRFRKIDFWKCPRIEDLSPLESLADIESISYYWNQKSVRFWNFGKNNKLKSFIFNDFTKVSDLYDLATSETLEHISFGNSASGNTGIVSLEPIGAISSLKELSFNPKKIQDNRVSPIIKLHNLKSLNFSNHIFTTEKVAWLTAHLPENIDSERLRPYVSLNGLISNCDILVVGKGKPFLNSIRDSKRLQKYISNFEALVDYYRSNAMIEEPK